MHRILFPVLFGAFALSAVASATAAEFSLYDAARAGDVEAVESLLAAGAEVDLPVWLDTPLHAAAASGQVEAARLLIAAGADIERHGFLGRPLHVAAAAGHLAVVDLLIASGADIDAVNAYGSTPLHFAAEHGRLDMATALLTAGADVNAWRATFRSSPLLGAIQGHHPSLVRLLVDKGAEVDVVGTACGGWSALHFAVEAGDRAIVKDLLKAGADPNTAAERGETPLAVAMTRGDGALVQLLREAGARQ